MATPAPVIIPIKTPGIDQLRKLERQMEALEKDYAKGAVAYTPLTTHAKFKAEYNLK